VPARSARRTRPRRRPTPRNRRKFFECCSYEIHCRHGVCLSSSGLRGWQGWRRAGLPRRRIPDVLGCLRVISARKVNETLKSIMTDARAVLLRSQGAQSMNSISLPPTML
jgi:hypothetical protein